MSNDLSASYALENDIDASGTSGWNSGAGFVPVGKVSDGQGNAFTGSFDGRGHAIHHLHIHMPNRKYIGMFGRIGGGAVVENVGLAEANVSGLQFVGTLAGRVADSLVENCEASGLVTIPADDSADAYAGGLVGWLIDSQLYASGSRVKVVALGPRSVIGGLCGRAGGGWSPDGWREPLCEVENCFSKGPVYSDGDHVGGLIGSVGLGSFLKCYSSGKVIGPEKQGLIGLDISEGYATFNYSYWDIEASGCDTSFGGSGKTTVQMMQRDTYSGWDFVNVWGIDEGRSRPYLLGPSVLQYLEIKGQSVLSEDSSSQYMAVLHQNDGTTKNVTASTAWQVEPSEFCEISGAGVLSTSNIDAQSLKVVISAEYREGISAERTSMSVIILHYEPIPSVSRWGALFLAAVLSLVFLSRGKDSPPI